MPKLPYHPAGAAGHHLPPACSRPASRHHRGNLCATRLALVAGS